MKFSEGTTFVDADTTMQLDNKSSLKTMKLQKWASEHTVPTKLHKYIAMETSRSTLDEILQKESI